MLKRGKKLIRIVREGGVIEGVRATRSFITKEKLFLLYLQLRSKNGLILREIQGSKMYLDISDPGISRELLFKGVHEELATRILRQEIKSGMTIVEIGANLGYYVLLEARIVGEEGKIYAFEPVPRNFNILTKNIEVNGYKNVKAYCKAVSSKSGTSKIALTDASNWGSMLDVKAAIVSQYMKQKMHKLAREVINVDTVSLYEFLDKERVNQINLIRMDIEGYEIEVIKSMLNILKNMPPPIKLFFEIHNKVFDNPEVTIGPLLEQLLCFGFKPKYIIVHDKILKNVRRSDFVQTMCSYRYECPHIILEK